MFDIPVLGQSASRSALKNIENVLFLTKFWHFFICSISRKTWQWLFSGGLASRQGPSFGVCFWSDRVFLGL